MGYPDRIPGGIDKEQRVDEEWRLTSRSQVIIVNNRTERPLFCDRIVISVIVCG
jgi:hypothetical protein